MRNPLHHFDRIKASHIWNAPRNGIIALITLYQKTLSPDYGIFREQYPYGFCPQEPTCSAYGKQSIQKHGLIIGLLLTLKRIASCHPWRKPTTEKMKKLSSRYFE